MKEYICSCIHWLELRLENCENLQRNWMKQPGAIMSLKTNLDKYLFHADFEKLKS